MIYAQRSVNPKSTISGFLIANETLTTQSTGQEYPARGTSKENIRALVAGAGLYSCDVGDGHRFWGKYGS